MFLFLTYDPTPEAKSPVYSTNNFRAIISDQDGAEHEAAIFFPDESRLVHLYVQPAFRGRTLTLRFLQRTDQTNWEKAAEFKFRNPIPLGRAK
jgi:hypothetical protein